MVVKKTLELAAKLHLFVLQICILLWVNIPFNSSNIKLHDGVFLIENAPFNSLHLWVEV